MPWQPPKTDRKKTVALVAALHVALGAGLVLGLAGDPIRRVSDAISTFDVQALPPPPPPPPVTPDESAAKREAGAPDLEARPAPVRLPVPPPLPTANESAPETGRASDAGAGQVAGPGRGANGGGDGTGGGGNGGTGSGSGGGLGSNARLIAGNLSRGDYRRIRGFGAPRGQAVLALEVGADGRVSRCLPFATSGNGALDGELCRLLSRTLWEPARDRAGRAVPVALRYVATWDRD
jgi:protein TonB